MKKYMYVYIYIYIYKISQEFFHIDYILQWSNFGYTGLNYIIKINFTCFILLFQKMWLLENLSLLIYSYWWIALYSHAQCWTVCMVQVEIPKQQSLDCRQSLWSESSCSSQALNMAVSYCLYSPVSDDIISFNPYFWFLEKFELKLNPYLISGPNLGVGFLDPAERTLIPLLHFSLGCFTLNLFMYLFIYLFIWLHLLHVKAPRLRVKSELQLWSML